MNKELKDKIIDTYKKYINDDATLSDVLNFFKISIGEDVIDNYIITKFDYDTPSIEVTSSKDNTKYLAKYTNKDDLLDIDSPDVSFIRLVKIKDNKRIDSIYHLNENLLAGEILTLREGDFSLCFHKLKSCCVNDCGDIGDYYRVQYSKRLRVNDQEVILPLFTNTFIDECNSEMFSNYDCTLAHANMNYNSQDKYTYMYDDGIFYGINGFNKDNVCKFFNGFCCERVRDDIKIDEYLPTRTFLRELGDNIDNARSIMYFNAVINESVYHKLKIFKVDNPDNVLDNDIVSEYVVKKWKPYCDELGYSDDEKEIITSKNSKYKRVSDGNISGAEVRSIIEELEHEFKDDIFIQIIVEDLKTFAYKIDNNSNYKKLDLLSPELLVNKSLSDIFDENQEIYFALAKDRFDELTGGFVSEKDSKVKKLTSKNIHLS